MGTRGLTCVFKNGEYKVAQYGQWDHYPSGQGLVVLNFLKSWDRKHFEKNLDTVSFLTEREIIETWKQIGADIAKDPWVDLETSNKHKKRYPEMSRDTGAEILDMINEKQNLRIESNLDFAGDSLFCEWLYLIDLDKNTFEIYEGFNKNTHLTKDDRFFDQTKEPKEGREYYYPVRLKKSYPLDALPEKEQFYKDLNGDEED